MKKIIISTGGTGGHVVLAQVLYDYLTDENEMCIVSDERGISYLNKKKYRHKQINVPKISFNFFRFFPFIISLLISFINSFIFLKKKKIKIIISTGGYMSIPICLAARILNLKIFLFEPNLVLGRANLFLLKYCSRIFTYSKKIKNLPKKMSYKNIIIKPLIRKNFFLSKRNIKRKNNKFAILIIGGSQGAKIFDNLFLKDLMKLSRIFKIEIFHQSSYENIKKLKKFYLTNHIKAKVFSYANNLHEIIKECDFAITRSGASTINELIFLKTPFLAIPFPFAKDDHQFYNAKYYVDKKLGWLIKENKVKNNFLYKFIKNLIKNKKLLIQRKKNMQNVYKKYNWNENSKNLKNLILK